ncbi:hypothetical protein CBW65_23630 [Tumebacillus avium]|uniref:Uncharacterized protein n=1 Tax=Tumebacillus avium TaxID=1903704 RepID=A0A1Y0IV57_9BACL|nr:hypothetical protein [Tumebacillus avium]ARU63676.1 hypothetical protein CBW65_23630 [Tumebacillus avium]
MNFKNLAVCSVALGSLLLPVAAYADSPKSAHLQGKVYRQLVAHGNNVSSDTLATYAVLADQDNNFKYFVHSDGTVDVIRIYPALSGMVYVNGQQVQVNNDGSYSVDVQPGKALVEFNAQGKLHKSKVLDVTSKSNLTVDLIETVQMSDVLAPMEEPISIPQSVIGNEAVDGGGGSYPGQTYSGQPVYTGNHVHCNRFNGIASDHRYWSWKTDWSKAIADFVGSDCDAALIAYGCPLPPTADNLCDGLNAQGNGVHDCSDAKGWPNTAWWRN